jgi:hypothetical protein
MYKAGRKTASCRYNAVYLVAAFLLISIVLLSITPISSIKNALGDGLFMEELSASFGDRKADLLIKMNPPVVTTETLQNQKPVIQFKLYDPITNEGFKHVTYFITIEKEGKKLISDWFHDHKGDLKIEMKPSNAERITVYGEPDPILQAFTGTENSPVVATGPIFTEGGLYHFIIRILTIDYDRSFIPDDKQPLYDGWLSVGLTEEQQITVDGKQMPIQILSYYDTLNGFNFNESKMQMKFTMPFDWNTTRLEKNQVFIHQEVSIPKQSELAANSYTGTVNGIDVTKNLLLDDSNSTKNVIHFMLPKPIVLQIAEQLNNNNNGTQIATSSDSLMKFTLELSGNVTSSTMADDTHA